LKEIPGDPCVHPHPIQSTHQSVFVLRLFAMVAAPMDLNPRSPPPALDALHRENEALQDWSEQQIRALAQGHTGYGG